MVYSPKIEAFIALYVVKDKNAPIMEKCYSVYCKKESIPDWNMSVLVG